MAFVDLSNAKGLNDITYGGVYEVLFSHLDLDHCRQFTGISDLLRIVLLSELEPHAIIVALSGISVRGILYAASTPTFRGVGDFFGTPL